MLISGTAWKSVYTVRASFFAAWPMNVSVSEEADECNAFVGGVRRSGMTLEFVGVVWA